MSAKKRILVPVDFSPCSRNAVSYAAELADKLDACVDLLYVWEVPPYIPPEAMIGVPGHDSTSLAGMARTHAEKEMKDFVEQVRVTAMGDTLLESGDPARTIVELAQQRQSEMVVMGTHGRTGLAHLLMGSVAEKVVRRSTRPVLTVPCREEEES